METILDRIVATKWREIEAARSRVSERALRQMLEKAPSIRNFRSPLERPGIQIIAEVKKASPSAGVLRGDFEPLAIAQIYESHGAAAISVLTDEPYFQGKLEYLSTIRKTLAVPVLRKDFIVDRYQLLEARAAGADAVLLIAEILDGPLLEKLLQEARSLQMEALVEFYEADNLARVVDSGAGIIGINNRNLRTFVTRLEHTLELAARLPDSCCVVSESGIRTREDVVLVETAGVKAVLVGETLMRSPDMGNKLDELRGVSQKDSAHLP